MTVRESLWEMSARPRRGRQVSEISLQYVGLLDFRQSTENGTEWKDKILHLKIISPTILAAADKISDLKKELLKCFTLKDSILKI